MTSLCHDVMTGANRNTLKEHFRRLVEQGHLVRRGAGKGSWYTEAFGLWKERGVEGVEFQQTLRKEWDQ